MTEVRALTAFITALATAPASARLTFLSRKNCQCQILFADPDASCTYEHVLALLGTILSASSMRRSGATATIVSWAGDRVDVDLLQTSHISGNTARARLVIVDLRSIDHRSGGPGGVVGASTPRSFDLESAYFVAACSLRGVVDAAVVSQELMTGSASVSLLAQLTARRSLTARNLCFDAHVIQLSIPAAGADVLCVEGPLHHHRDGWQWSPFAVVLSGPNSAAIEMELNRALTAAWQTSRGNGFVLRRSADRDGKQVLVALRVVAIRLDSCSSVQFDDDEPRCFNTRTSVILREGRNAAQRLRSVAAAATDESPSAAASTRLHASKFVAAVRCWCHEHEHAIRSEPAAVPVANNLPSALEEYGLQRTGPPPLPAAPKSELRRPFAALARTPNATALAAVIAAARNHGGNMLMLEPQGERRQSFATVPPRQTLATARVIAQWANRFVLSVGTTKTGDGGDPVQVLLCCDQHALSERLRLETFVQRGSRAFVRGRSRLPVPRAVPPQFADAVAAALSTLREWHFDVVSRDGGYLLEACPLVELEGVSKAPEDPLAAMLGFVQLLNQTAMAAEPAFIHDALVERSCRGAIMFGDSMSNAEAATLQRDVARTAHRYDVCSHGRVGVAQLMPLRPLCAAVDVNPYLGT